jgi:hypothetical protein
MPGYEDDLRQGEIDVEDLLDKLDRLEDLCEFIRILRRYVGRGNPAYDFLWAIGCDERERDGGV